MSTPLIALASILAFFAIVIIPFMFIKSGKEQPHQPHHDHGDQGKKARKKKRKR